MNAVAFSIYGSDPKYVAGAVRNAERVPEAYPGFTAVFYLDTRTTPPELPGRLRALGAEVRSGRSTSAPSRFSPRRTPRCGSSSPGWAAG